MHFYFVVFGWLVELSSLFDFHDYRRLVVVFVLACFFLFLILILFIFTSLFGRFSLCSESKKGRGE